MFKSITNSSQGKHTFANCSITSMCCSFPLKCGDCKWSWQVFEKMSDFLFYVQLMFWRQVAKSVGGYLSDCLFHAKTLLFSLDCSKDRAKIIHHANWIQTIFFLAFLFEIFNWEPMHGFLPGHTSGYTEVKVYNWFAALKTVFMLLNKLLNWRICVFFLSK